MAASEDDSSESENPFSFDAFLKKKSSENDDKKDKECKKTVKCPIVFGDRLVEKGTPEMSSKPAAHSFSSESDGRSAWSGD